MILDVNLIKIAHIEKILYNAMFYSIVENNFNSQGLNRGKYGYKKT